MYSGADAACGVTILWDWRFGIPVGVLHEVKQSDNKLLVDFRHQEAGSAAVFQILLYYIDTRTVVAVRCRRIGRIASNSFDMAVKPIRKNPFGQLLCIVVVCLRFVLVNTEHPL